MTADDVVVPVRERNVGLYTGLNNLNTNLATIRPAFEGLNLELTRIRGELTGILVEVTRSADILDFHQLVTDLAKSVEDTTVNSDMCASVR